MDSLNQFGREQGSWEATKFIKVKSQNSVWSLAKNFFAFASACSAPSSCRPTLPPRRSQAGSKQCWSVTRGASVTTCGCEE